MKRFIGMLYSLVIVTAFLCVSAPIVIPTMFIHFIYSSFQVGWMMGLQVEMWVVEYAIKRNNYLLETLEKLRIRAAAEKEKL